MSSAAARLLTGAFQHPAPMSASLLKNQPLITGYLEGIKETVCKSHPFLNGRGLFWAAAGLRKINFEEEEVGDMRIVSLACITTLLALPPWSISADIPRPDGQQEPQLKMPRPPQNPLLFTRVAGDQKQSLEVFYLGPRTISFKLTKSGTCSGHKRGTAKIKQYWWLGVETDENEAGEAVAVQEYVYGKKGKCTIYFRIDENQWEQATVKESPGCSTSCPASAEPMYLKKR